MARRKQTEPVEDVAAEDLPELTHQQQKFVEGLLEGRTASDSYRRAYDASNMLNEAVWVEASRLRHGPKVSLWIAAAQKAGLSKAECTFEGHLRELERLRQIALETGNVGAAVQAEQLRGKASGHYTDRIEMVDHDPVATLREIASHSPELAKSLAQDHGIVWESESETRH